MKLYLYRVLPSREYWEFHEHSIGSFVTDQDGKLAERLPHCLEAVEDPTAPQITAKTSQEYVADCEAVLQWLDHPTLRALPWRRIGVAFSDRPTASSRVIPVLRDLVEAAIALPVMSPCPLTRATADNLLQAITLVKTLASWAIGCGGLPEAKIESAEPPTKPEVVWLGKSKIRIGDKSLSLEPQQAAVLGALVKLGSATTPELVKESGYSDAVAVLKNLRKKFPDLAPHIQLPGRRGEGGYSTTIKAE